MWSMICDVYRGSRRGSRRYGMNLVKVWKQVGWIDAAMADRQRGTFTTICICLLPLPCHIRSHACVYLPIYIYLPLFTHHIPYNTRRKHMNMYRQSPCFNSLSHLCYVGKPFDNLLAVGMFKPVHPSIHIYLNEGRIHIYTYYTHIHIYLHVAHCIHIGIHIHILQFALLCAHIGIYIYIISLPASYYTIDTIRHHDTLLLVRLMFIPLQLLVKSY